LITFAINFVLQSYTSSVYLWHLADVCCPQSMCSVIARPV